GDVRYAPAATALIENLSHEHARPRFFAAEALGRIGDGEAITPLLAMLEANNGEDTYLRQAGAIALGRIGDAEALSALTDHASDAVRVAAVVALGRMRHPAVAAFLTDSNEFVATDAAR